jgi:hypothetical protein
MRPDAHTLGVLAGLGALLAVIGLTACSGARPDPAVIRVGDKPITRRAVDHLTSAITRGALVANLTGSTQPGAREEALSLLIGSAWLQGEAARAGLRPSHGEIARLVQRQRRTAGSPGGFAASLEETGQTLADVEAEARARWAAGALKQRLGKAVDSYARARVTDRVIAAFYRAHLARYHLPERRYYDLYEQIPKRAEAEALARKLRRGEAIDRRPNKEKPFRSPTLLNSPEQAAAFRAVFAAKKLNVVVGPLPLQGAWCLFILRRIVPARLQPLAEVRGSIDQELRARLQRSERARLIAAYRARWRARTDCTLGYVVQKCRQYRGPNRSEPNAFAPF